jgi:hypothetical protein
MEADANGECERCRTSMEQFMWHDDYDFDFK